MTHSNLHAQTGVLPMRRPARSSTAHSNLPTQTGDFPIRRPARSKLGASSIRRRPARSCAAHSNLPTQAGALPILRPARSKLGTSQYDTAPHSPARHIPISTPRRALSRYTARRTPSSMADIALPQSAALLESHCGTTGCAFKINNSIPLSHHLRKTFRLGAGDRRHPAGLRRRRSGCDFL